MFSKMQLSILACVLGLVACAGEERPRTTEPKLLDEGYCLKSFGKDFSEFFKGQKKSQEVEGVWNCSADAIVKFLDFTKGSSDDAYTGQNFYNFLRRFFLTDEDFSPQLIDEFMELKRVILGGSNQLITRRELLSAIPLIKEIKTLAVEISPHMGVIYRAFSINDDAEMAVTPEQVNAAEIALAHLADSIGAILQRRPTAYYSFESMRRLFEALDIMLYSGEDSFLRELAKAMPLVGEVKGSFIALPYERIDASQWRLVFQTVARGAGLWMRFNAFVKRGDLSQGQGLEQLGVLSNSALDLLQERISALPEQKVPAVSLQRMVDQAAFLGEFPLGLTADQLKELILVVLDRLLAVTPEGEKLESKQQLDLTRVEHARHEFNFWKEAQETILSPTEIVRSAQDELQRAAQGPWPLALDEKGRLIFNLQSPLPYDHDSLTQLNWQRAIIRVLLRSYAEDSERRTNLGPLTEDELKVAAGELAPLGAAMGLYEIGDKTIHKRILQKSDIFMPRSNGQGQLDFEEAIDFFAITWSGKAASEQIFEQLSECKMQDAAGKDVLAVGCFREKFLEHSDLLSPLPELAQFLEGSSGTANWLAYEKFMEQTIRSGYSDEPITQGNLIEAWSLFQYIEVFYGRFDSTHSTTINYEESLTAFRDTYEGPLTQLLGGLGEEGDVQALFTYMMKFGQTPLTDGKLGGGVRFKHWKWHPEGWVYEANRLRLIQILATLSSM